MGAQHEILNHEGLVAFEARAGRDGPGLDDALLMNSQIGALGALAPAFARRTLLGQGLAGLLHAARLDLGPAFEPLETGDLVPLGRDGALQLGALDHERNHQRLEIRKRPRVQISGQSHARNQSEITPAGNPIRPDFRPSYGPPGPELHQKCGRATPGGRPTCGGTCGTEGLWRATLGSRARPTKAAPSDGRRGWPNRTTPACAAV